MAKVLDWKKSDDTRDIVHLSVQALAEGHIVAVPTDTCYFAVASGVQDGALQKLRLLAQEYRQRNAILAASQTALASLVVRGPSELHDFCPAGCTTAHRLAMRMWPGPVHMQIPCDCDHSLFDQLPLVARHVVQTSDKMASLCLPAHPVLREIVRLTAAPLIITPLADKTGGAAITAEMIDAEPVAMIVDGGLTKYQGLPTVISIRQNECRVVRPGITSIQELQSLSRILVLLVCTGNTCRSPMAEKLMEAKLLKRLGLDAKSPKGGAGSSAFIPIVALSAGIASAGGGPASPQAVAAMAEMGLDLSEHQSCAVTQKEIESADLILPMTRNHLQAIISRWPNVAHKTHLISGRGEDVSDPFGGPVQLYRDCAVKLNEYLDRWIDQLMATSLPNWIEI